VYQRRLALPAAQLVKPTGVQPDISFISVRSVRSGRSMSHSVEFNEG
jgi:hypothetical protein